MEKQEIRKLLEELTEIAGIENIKLEFKDMKRKLASTSLGRKTIRLNRVVLTFPEEIVRYILAHEIAHLKVKTRYHCKEFREVLTQLVNDDIERLERKLIEFLL